MGFFGKNFKLLSKDIDKLIISICWANNPKEIEPIQNNRFKNIEELWGGNISINWYLRPIVKEWLEDIDKLEQMFEKVSKRYSQYLDCIVPGGLRWTEGIEYGLVEVRDLKLPNISKLNNIKTLNNDDWEKIMDLSKKYFYNMPVFYHSSCALSLALSKSNISMTNFSKKIDCSKSKCPDNQKKKCEIKNHVNTNRIQNELNKTGFGIKVVEFDKRNGKLESIPPFESLSPALQQEINHTIAILNNKTKLEIIKENYILEDILRKLKLNDQICCITFVGSVIYSENPQDIDLLVLVENVKNNNEAIKMVKNSLSVDYKIIQLDDSIRVCNDLDLDINIATFDLNYFENKVKNIFENNQIYGEHRSWCLGYWLPEVLIKDLVNAEIYFENTKNKYFSNLVNLTKLNNNKIMEKIEEECIKEIGIIINELLKYNDENLLFQFQIMKSSLILALIRYYFLKNKKAGHSFKNIDILNDYEVDFKDKIGNLIKSIEGKEVIQLTNSILNRGEVHPEKAMHGNLAI